VMTKLVEFGKDYGANYYFKTSTTVALAVSLCP